MHTWRTQTGVTSALSIKVYDNINYNNYPPALLPKYHISLISQEQQARRQVPGPGKWHTAWWEFPLDQANLASPT